MHLLLRVTFVASVALSSLGCNFIFNPDGDGVLRCDNADDCDAPLFDALADQRGQSACGGGQGSSDFNQAQTGKVCSVIDKEDVSCDPNVAAPESPFAVRYAEATSDANSIVYKACLSDEKGTLGCQPLSSGTCMQGTPRTYTLTVGEYDNPTVEERTICAPDGVDAVEPNDSLLGWDVLDQHCRSYFCDESFVCNRGRGAAAFRCVRCDPSKAYGQGGCGTMMLEGAVSTVYTADLGGAACLDTADGTKTQFGPAVAPKAPPAP